LKGMTFLDIGCGSGLFSLAAYRMGAKRITSFDLDPFSVRCCEYLKEKEGNPENWIISTGSVLDVSFLNMFEKADIVYSWGVLHHTGIMWQAIRNASNLVKPDGLFFIGIYNKKEGFFGSRTWLRLKKLYNGVPLAGKRLIEFGFTALIILSMLLRLKNPISEIKNYKKKRGMSFWIDIRDSLGGYPYEFAYPEEVIKFCEDELSFKIEELKTVNNLGVNEFLFRKSSSNYTNPIMFL
ncbi:MAG: class I SAM-dependent methyltransferase, partial [Nitrospirae bacterium]|nr:class I SAM-dependent methyltransferase [Nitrospirota bacterium]